MFFFGASITQQQNGYSYHFGLRNPNLNIKNFGYVNQETFIKILQDDFDRSLCEHNCNWGINKCLKSQTIYYISGDLKS